MQSSIYLVAEDIPGLAIGRKLVAEAPPLEIHSEVNGNGFGTLKNKTPIYQKIGVYMPVLMLTDLDNHRCPSGLIQEWLGTTPSEGFLFRICVHEVEAWILAHRAAMAAFLGIPETRIPVGPEKLADPKAELIRLAQKSSRKIREGLTPIGSATIGPNYNVLLEEFIRTSWTPSIAAAEAPSPRRRAGERRAAWSL